LWRAEQNCNQSNTLVSISDMSAIASWFRFTARYATKYPAASRSAGRAGSAAPRIARSPWQSRSARPERHRRGLAWGPDYNDLLVVVSRSVPGVTKMQRSAKYTCIAKIRTRKSLLTLGALICGGIQGMRAAPIAVGGVSGGYGTTIETAPFLGKGGSILVPLAGQ
jgi:hypothetical protein